MITLDGSSQPGSSSPSTTPQLLPSDLYDAVIALLQHLRQSTTALSLSFKPPVSQEAAIFQLDKISDLISKLTSSALALQLSSQQGSIVAREWHDGIQHIVAAMQQLLEALADLASYENGYLAKTGVVWDAIDALLQNAPRDEGSAVVKAWSQDRELMKDAWEEFKELLVPAVGPRFIAADPPKPDLGGELDQDYEDIFGVEEQLTAQEQLCAQQVRA
jgi:hypothetical protein